VPRANPSRARDIIELVLGYALIVGIIWSPDRLQRILSPVALVLTLLAVLARKKSRDELGVGTRGLRKSLWILPAAIALCAVSIFVAAKVDALHPLYKGDLKHIVGYVLWTIYQQFLLQDFFMDRLLRMMPSAAAVTLAGILFATAHLPNLVLTAACVVWGIVSCVLFRRYGNLWMLGLAQGMLGLCFAICVPDSLHHHLRVGLGYLRYHSAQPVP
jgi:membrane protease YdiL (CAAX protease family)